jgi:hypothetical protein
VFQFFALLRGQVRFKKCFARIVSLCPKIHRPEKEKQAREQNRTDSPDAMTRRNDRPHGHSNSNLMLHGFADEQIKQGKSSPLFAKGDSNLKILFPHQMMVAVAQW